METVSAPVNTQMFERVSHAAGRHYLVDVWRRFRRNYLALAGLIVLIVLVGAAIAAPLITTGEPNKADLRPEMSLVGPNFDHFFGTDDAGRDWFTRSMYGARVSLMVAFFAMAISIAIGTTVGCVAGFFGGWVDSLLMRIADMALSLPFLPFVIVLTGFLGADTRNIVLAVALLLWPNSARVIRSQVLTLRERAYVEAARVTGASQWRILFVHIAPNILPLSFVYAAIAIGWAIITEASVNFLGFGDPTSVSWGMMLQDAFSSQALSRGQYAWFVPPGICIILVVVAGFFISRGYEEVFMPRLRGR